MTDASRLGFVDARLVIALSAMFLARTVCSQNSSADPAVKKSRQGICHERGTVSYVQTIYFDSFPSMQACLSSGGRQTGLSAAMPLDRSIHWWDRLTSDDVDKAAAIAVIAAAIVLVAIALLTPWYRKRRIRRKYREFAASERRRWEGHRRQ